MERFNRWLIVFAFASAILVKALEANIAVFDEVRKKRAEEAKKAALEDYQPYKIEKVTDNFNRQVHEYNLPYDLISHAPPPRIKRITLLEDEFLRLVLLIQPYPPSMIC